MKKCVVAMLQLTLLTLLTTPGARLAWAGPPDDAPALRAAVDRAVWPGDIVRAADQYLRACPDAPDAAEVQAVRQRAGDAWRLVNRNDVRLYRSAFTPNEAAGETLHDIRLAALGDRNAAVRLAHASRTSDDAQGTQRYVGWLQLAASLGDENASYELALHFRRTAQPILAARYEARAMALGYEPANGLDNVRK
jgi:hypothetical protein